MEEGFEAAASFATQPLPRGNRVVVYTIAGGWGVVTADAIARTDLELLPLPGDLRASLDEHLPPRWSRNNPVDLAGSETRDTIPDMMEIVVSHDSVDAVIFLGMGIQGNLARMEREGPFYPDGGLERIVEYHERQEERFAQAAGRPLNPYAQADPDRHRAQHHRPGDRRSGACASGRLCYASSNRAVTALEHLWHYARWRQRRGLSLELG